MPVLLINDELYGDTPTDRQEEIEGRLETVENSIQSSKNIETGTFIKPITTGTYDREMLYKKDGIAYLSCRLHSTSVYGYTTNWLTLPEGFKPRTDIGVGGVYLNGYAKINGVVTPLPMWVPNSGAIQQSYGAIEATELAIVGSFAVAE